MTILELTFPAGRYHATPWGRHVNEGAVEWPPSPWRILRALVATWHLKAQEEVEASTVEQLINALAQEDPFFHLPWAVASHTRHYMPVIEGGNEKNAKIFDAFVQTPLSEPVRVVWSVDLPHDQLQALRLLVLRMGYLGRAESLVMGRVLENLPELDERTHWVASPMVEGEILQERWQVVRTLCALATHAYTAWRNSYMDRLVSTKPAKRGAKKGPSIAEALFDALHADTATLQKEGWNLPPGAHYVSYTRPESAFTPRAAKRNAVRKRKPTTARFAVVSNVAPRITQAISVADRVHKALCKYSDQGHGPSPVYTGKLADGTLRLDHGHASIFCEANGSGDAITHVLVHAPMGFDEQALYALRRLNKVWGHGGHDVRLVLHATGQPTEFGACPILGTSRVWRSVTPYVSTRHAKTYRDGRPKMDANGWPIGSPGHDLLRLLAEDARYAGASIRQIPARERPFQFGERRLAALEFQTLRSGGPGRRGNDIGAAFEITFPTPVQGPIALGYGAHFGLGLFAPVA